MKTFKHWVKKSVEIQIDGSKKEISVVAGSDSSEQDAADQAHAKAKRIEGYIKKRSKPSYQPLLMEHVERTIDSKNVVTVCRYGAKVLNTTQYTILDLDDYPLSLLDYFKPIRKLEKKERIVTKFLENLEKTNDLGSDFRIYETAKGVRVIARRYLDPQSPSYNQIMRRFKVDPVYVRLTKKQECYRARLTPKPIRIKMKGFKLSNPLDINTSTYKNWLSEYERKSDTYSVVRFIQSIGKDFSSEEIIKFHDDACNISRSRRLA